MTILQSILPFDTRPATLAGVLVPLVVILTRLVEKNKDLVEDALPGPCLIEWLPFIVVRINPQLLLRHHLPLRQ